VRQEMKDALSAIELTDAHKLATARYVASLVRWILPTAAAIGGVGIFLSGSQVLSIMSYGKDAREEIGTTLAKAKSQIEEATQSVAERIKSQEQEVEEIIAAQVAERLNDNAGFRQKVAAGVAILVSSVGSGVLQERIPVTNNEHSKLPFANFQGEQLTAENGAIRVKSTGVFLLLVSVHWTNDGIEKGTNIRCNIHVNKRDRGGVLVPVAVSSLQWEGGNTSSQTCYAVVHCNEEDEIQVVAEQWNPAGKGNTIQVEGSSLTYLWLGGKP